MTAIGRVEPKFVREVPRELEPGRLYISMIYSTALHLCCCGCGNEVVTPLHPMRWRLGYDGEGVSLFPSIGSWSLPCRSHYFIVRNEVRWAPDWSNEEIEAARARDRVEIERYFDPDAPEETHGADGTDLRTGRVQSFVARLGRLVTRR